VPGRTFGSKSAKYKREKGWGGHSRIPCDGMDSWGAEVCFGGQMAGEGCSGSGCETMRSESFLSCSAAGQGYVRGGRTVGLRFCMLFHNCVLGGFVV
jgi:hypothetical protein